VRPHQPPSPRRGAHAPPLVAIVGPTASGKTDLALALAKRLALEVVVADSRQVYRGMDIGTAKPDPAARRAVAHHLLDLVEPDASFTVADWLAGARAVLPEIAGRGRLPLVVGGSGLYITALIDGYDFTTQPYAPDVRARLAAELEADGLAPLAERLGRLDPARAARIDVRNPRRVLRALERAEASGGPVGEGRAEPYSGRVALIGLDRPREVLYRRIDERARRLFEGGLLDEVRGLLSAGYGPELAPMSGHGYREAARHLAGDCGLEAAIAATARRTRQYAKRQLTWFRRDRRIVWLPLGERPADDSSVVDRVLRLAGPLLA
jgi:tRNA dimethylallyltransferase